MYLRKLHIKNFKSYEDQEIIFENLSIIVGANASGKSNIIDVFRFIQHISEYGINNALSLLGGLEYILNSNIGKDKPLSIYLEIEIPKNGEKMFINPIKLVYEFEIKAHKRGSGFRIVKDIVALSFYVEIENNNSIVNSVYQSTPSGKIKETIDVLEKEKYSEEEYNKIVESISLSQMITFINSMEDKKELILNKMQFPFAVIFEYAKLIKVYDFDSKLLKKSSMISSKIDLDEDGANIALVIQRILQSKDSQYNFLTLLNNCLPFITNVKVKANYDKSIFYSITEKYSSKEFRSNFLSDGTANIIAIIIALYFETNNRIIILEEPERNVHPKLMSKILEMAEETSKNKQIIITTHTPELIKNSNINSILFVRRKKNGFSTISKPGTNETVLTFLKNEIGIDELFIEGLLF